MIDMEAIYRDYGIEQPEKFHKHSHKGWIQCECPFCEGNAGYHLGYNLLKGYYNCYICGGHETLYTLAALLKLPKPAVKGIIQKYTVYAEGYEDEPVYKTDKVFMPANCKGLLKLHADYLRKRGFIPKTITEKYRLQFTGAISTKGWEYRIIIPVLYKGIQVSTVGRAIGQHNRKYMVASKEDELIHHKHILYNLDNCKGERIVLLEGCTDVWKFGDGAAASFGTEVKPKQLTCLYEYKQIFILFDNEDTAQAKAEKIAWRLSAMGKSVEVVRLESDNDVGDLSADDIKQLREELEL